MTSYQYKTQPFAHQRTICEASWQDEYLLSVRYSGIMQRLSSPASDSSGSCLYSDRLSTFQNCYRATGMNYQKHYEALIQRARLRATPDGYTERHHIVPRCMGGGNESGNIVRLTAEEHFVAHQLLVKIYPTQYKLAIATHMLTSTLGERNNKAYGWVKRAHAKAMRAANLGAVRTKEHSENIRRALTGAGNPQYGKLRTEEERAKIKAGMTPEAREKIRQGQLGRRHTDAAKQLNRIAHLGRKASPETLAKLSALSSGENNPMFGKKLSAESIARMRQKKIGSPLLKLRGVPLSAEHRAKLSAAKRNRTPEQRAEAARKSKATRKARSAATC